MAMRTEILSWLRRRRERARRIEADAGMLVRELGPDHKASLGVGAETGHVF
jgi:hypothetical protein